MKKSISTIFAASLFSSIALATVIKQGQVIDARGSTNLLETKKPGSIPDNKSTEEAENIEESIGANQLAMLQSQLQGQGQEQSINPEAVDFNNINQEVIRKFKLPLFPVYDYQIMLYYYGMKSKKSFVELLMTHVSPVHLPKEVQQEYYAAYALQSRDAIASLKAKKEAGEDVSMEALNQVALAAMLYRPPTETILVAKSDRASARAIYEAETNYEIIKKMLERFSLSDSFKQFLPSDLIFGSSTLPGLLDFLKWNASWFAESGNFSVTDEEMQAIQALQAFVESRNLRKEISIADWDNLPAYSMSELRMRGQQWQAESFSPALIEDKALLAEFRKNQRTWVYSLIKTAKENVKEIDVRIAPKLAMIFHEKKTESGFGQENPIETAEAIEKAKERKEAMNRQEELYRQGIYDSVGIPSASSSAVVPDYVPSSDVPESDVPVSDVPTSIDY
ncbi:MAG: hypothetical protein VX642_01000 [Bdellovibrionota bacterium]|nr:hypothetical protein [Bdellovibrionota bacterium]